MRFLVRTTDPKSTVDWELWFEPTDLHLSSFQLCPGQALDHRRVVSYGKENYVDQPAAGVVGKVYWELGDISGRRNVVHSAGIILRVEE